ncbi:MAG: exodeoxyribonuclease V subunit alpha [Deltaproteobacteria bacterium]|nr:exodeoxyribonuclease V subunit alpha [Deltaproteobacteria bacterium]
MIRPRPGPLGVLAPGHSAELLEGAALLDLDAGSLWLAWELAALQPGARPEDRELLQRAVAAVLAAQQLGSTWLPLDSEELLTTLALEGEALARLRALLHDPTRSGAVVSGLGDPPRPLLLHEDALTLRRIHRAEAGLGQRLRSRLGPATDSDVPTRLDETGARAALERAVAATPPGAPRLTPEQQEACVAALSSPLTVITGGPGTGKTTIVDTLLRALELERPEALAAVALTAPTGKAADRLHAVLRSGGELRRARLRPAATLHRLLGYWPRQDTFAHHENNPLEASLVICDEASMIDLHLMDRLLRALRPGAHLVLLGDADQLPPVGAGAVLRDLCEASGSRAVVRRLSQSHRQSEGDPAGAAILRAARGLHAGDLPALLGGDDPALPRRDRVDRLAWQGAELLTAATATERQTFLAAWEDRHLVLPEALAETLRRPVQVGESGRVEDPGGELAALLRHHDRARILGVTRVPAGGTGTEAINQHFVRRLATRLGQPLDLFAPGTPVMVTTNDYTHGLFNGDTGLIVRGRAAGGHERPAPMALFSRGEELRAFSLGSLAAHLEPAWAITVHKAQGSEYEEVALLLPSVEVKLLAREILYTGVTRARRAAVIVGESARLEQACVQRAARHTRLPALLT